MRSLCRLVFLLLSLFPLVLPAQNKPSSPLQVDESGVRFRLMPKAALEIPVVNLSSATVSANLEIRLIDQNDEEAFKWNGTLQEKPGRTVEKISLDVNQLPTDGVSELGWLRLRYELTTKDDTGEAAQGTLQVGPLLVDAFEVRITGADEIKLGEKYPVRVRVDDPKTGKPLAGVALEVVLEPDETDEDSSIVRNLKTDDDGYVLTEFHVPQTSNADKATVKATVRRGDFTQEESVAVRYPTQAHITLSSDKPLYQPGQTVHIRLLALGPDKHALADGDIKVTIEDESGQNEFEDTFKTSKFGIATADWEIPEKIRLGQYAIQVAFDSHDYTGQSSAQIRISRYELPAYTVKATPDRTYYLPGQDAKVEVSANYLFGKPVQHAHVKVVRQDGGTWDAEKSMWVGSESNPVEGEFDSAGKFVASIGLNGRFIDVDKASGDWYEDVTCAAYVTDLSTGRTEQRRFTLRASKNPIHFYVSAPRAFVGEPLAVYVTAFYADGEPAVVDGTLEGAKPAANEEFQESPDAAHRARLARFHTNRYGVARVPLPPLAEDFLETEHYNNEYGYGYNAQWQEGFPIRVEPDYGAWNALFIAQGADRNGKKGWMNQEIVLSKRASYMRVETDHMLYHPDDPIKIEVWANAKISSAVVDVSSDAGLVTSQVVHLLHGYAELTIPYDVKLRGHVVVMAYAITGATDENRALAGSADIIYPAPQNLRVDVQMKRTTFRPGETADASFQVKTPDGGTAESALGVLVYDRAVAERVRTDEEFGGHYGFWIYDYEPYYYPNLGNVSFPDLMNLDSDKAFPDGMDLVAKEILNSGYQWTGPWMSGGMDDYAKTAGQYFYESLAASTKSMGEILKKTFRRKVVYPKSEDELRAELRDGGLYLDDVRDPWDVPYRPVFDVYGPYDRMFLISNGVDKQANTKDDFSAANYQWPYYEKMGKAIDVASQEYVDRTGKYIRDFATLRDELAGKNIQLDELRDPWGHPYSYTFDIEGANYRIQVLSPGPDGKFDKQTERSWDDVPEWTSDTHYFQKEGKALEQSLAEHFAATGNFPQTQQELDPVLRDAKLSSDKLIDPWGHPYHFAFTTTSQYGDRVDISAVSVYGSKKERRTTEVTPVTQKVGYVQVVSDGRDEKNPAQIVVTEFSRVMTEQSSKDITARPMPKEPPRTGGNGGIEGTVTDPTGAIIPNAQVTALNDGTQDEFDTNADVNGHYVFKNLPSGIYRVIVESTGFRMHTVIQVPVQSASTTQVDVSLSVGSTSQMVTVEANAISVQTDTAEVSSIAAKKAEPPTEQAKPLYTPRVRQYFPETLLWSPEVMTDKHGHAHISFPMADNITEWTMSVVASNLAGQVGVSEKELHTFQPFFMEHDPPKVLTEGDKIHLPVVLRNYTDTSQSLKVTMDPAPWFSILSGGSQNVTVAANGNANVVFPFEASHSVRNGKQRVTAANTETGDAVEKEVTVHPNGQEISFTTAGVLAGQNDALDVTVPDTAIVNSTDAELQIYPNLAAHVLGSLKGIGMRPAGCAEQITSTAYISLLALRLLNKTKQNNTGATNPRAQMAAAALKAVQQGHDELIGVQNADGGFPYWSGNPSDMALTAYAVRFMEEAADVIKVDENVTNRAATYLTTRQTKSGAWTAYDWQTEKEEESLNLTAYITRTLATRVGRKHQFDSANTAASLKIGMAYLEDHIAIWKDPYLVGNYAIAAATSKDETYIAQAEALLASVAHREGAGTYWNLEANTSPFYGWGNTGRVETTALAVEALAIIHHDSSDAQEVGRGLQYLLTHRDRYCVWWSTQASENVVEAIIAAMPEGEDTNAAPRTTVVVNGTTVSTVQLPAPQAVVGPVTVSLAQYLRPGQNKVEIVREGNQSAINAILVTSYYVPWSVSRATNESNFLPGDTRALRLKVHYDQTNARAGEKVHCEVEAERIGFKGYGMMLAEIGLPPGAEVDRASLNRGFMYEVQPDRVVFYLWPNAGGADFGFDFRLRYKIDAMSTDSQLYDYYNPEPNATVVPVRFISH